jgi:hypothetical protein
VAYASYEKGQNLRRPKYAFERHGLQDWEITVVNSLNYLSLYTFDLEYVVGTRASHEGGCQQRDDETYSQVTANIFMWSAAD